MLGVLALSGCGTPPSVAPLLAVAQRAVREEASRQEEDLARELAQVDQVRKSLATAFEKDLAQTDELTADWVRDAVTVYTAAREELVRHEATLREARGLRADNLRAAEEALKRASWLLQAQDAAMQSTLGTTGWRLLEPKQNFKETAR